jgi:hypothetical protein
MTFAREIPADDPRQRFFLLPATRLAEFVTSNLFVDIIEGPLGSGKTVVCCLRVMRHAQEQTPSPIDGMRKTRWAIVRNSYPDLKRTTIRTWLDTFPEAVYGRFTWGQPPQHRIAFADVRMEVDFLALDKPEDIRKLRSGEYTGIVFNELPFIEKEIFDEATSRVGRYPSMREGGPTWRGVFADANAPDEDHWLAMMTGQVDLPPGLTEDEAAQYQWPDDWGFHLQPPALLEQFDQHNRLMGYEVNPGAENLENLPPDYYAKQIAGKSRTWIDSRLMVRVVLVVEGAPVWPMFKADVHVAREPLRPVPGHDVTVGLDFGRTPAAVFIQAVNNRVLVQYELQENNMGAVDFAPRVKRFLEQHYPADGSRGRFRVRFVGDPKGQDKTQNDDRTAYDIFEANGMKVIPAPVKQNMIRTRVDAVANVLNEMSDGRPRFVISPMARSLKVGMAGRYHNERDETGELKPSKNRYSHLCDALQYGILGLGEGRRMVGLDATGSQKPVRYHKGRGGTRRRVA